MRSVEDLYPDLSLPASVGYTRLGVPLLPMTLLYERLVVYVPPVDSRALQARWGMAYNDFLRLVDAGIVQPLIGRVTDYTGKQFRLLLEAGPPVPSVWTRGLTLLGECDLDWTLRPESYRLDFDELAMQPSLLTKYRKHFPRLTQTALHERIKAELLTNLADLALFGEHDLLDEIQRADGSVPSDDLARTILLLSEVRAYPTLFGLGGTANYDKRYIAALPNIGDDIRWAMSQPNSRHLSQDTLSALLRNIGFDVSKLTVDQVLEFHTTPDARTLRRTLQRFEVQAQKTVSTTGVPPDLDPVLAEAQELDRLLQAVNKQTSNTMLRRKYDRAVTATSWSLQIGGLALGGWVGSKTTGTPIGAVGGAVILKEAVIAPLRPLLTSAIVSRRFSPGVANLWRIRARRK